MTSRDPTRSAGLRRHGRTLVNRRVHALYQRLRQGFQEHDVAGLRQADQPTISHVAFINWMESVSHKLARAEGMIGHVVEATLLAPVDWPHELIEKAVERGIELVESELRTSLGHLDASEVSRLHAGAATAEVRGIAGETVRRLLRHVVRSLEVKEAPEALMREVRKTIEKITRLRLHLMVNTGVVRAVNAGKLFAYESEGITRVGIEPEWLPHTDAHQHNRLADHHPRLNGAAVLLDVRSKKSKRRQRTASNKARRKRRKTPEEEILETAFTEGSAALGGGLAVEIAGELLKAVLEPEEPEPTLVNVLTAGDDRVCQDCEDIAADGPYELDEARALIPAHPNCRCAFIPFGDKRFAPLMEQEEAEEEWEE